MAKYTARHARAGLTAKMPKLEVLPNQFRGYIIVITIPEYTSLCPKTGLPDAGTITIEYEPGKYFVELKSLKMYIQAYRDLGIFYENAVNRIARDFMEAVKPSWVHVQGEFNPRGGITSKILVKLGTPAK
jgi:7-cyano-7-deazaguanine reductase